jgi:hypothetical protein
MKTLEGHCVAEQHLRSRSTMTHADLVHAARALAKHPDSIRLLQSLHRAQDNKAMVDETLRLHMNECETCFGPVKVSS